MVNIQKAFLKFWSSFGVPAYLDEQAIEYDAHGNARPPNMPYITFAVVDSDFLTSTIVSGRIWTQGASFLPALNIAGKIKEAVPVGGIDLRLDNGESIKLSRGTPFFQYQPMDDQTLKVGYINLEARFYTF